MPPTKVAYFTKLDPHLREAMRRYKEAVGVPEAQQVERALRAWLAERPEAWPLPQVSRPRTKDIKPTDRQRRRHPASRKVRR